MEHKESSAEIACLLRSLCCKVSSNHTDTVTAATYFVNQLHNDQLENVPEGVNLVNTCAQVIQSSILSDMIFTIKDWEKNSPCVLAQTENTLQTWSAWINIMKAFLLQLASFSFTKKSWINSGASGIRLSKFLTQINTVSSLDMNENHTMFFTYKRKFKQWCCTYRWCKWLRRHFVAHSCDGALDRHGLLAWEAPATRAPSVCTGNEAWSHGWTHWDAAGPEITGNAQYENREVFFLKLYFCYTFHHFEQNKSTTQLKICCTILLLSLSDVPQFQSLLQIIVNESSTIVCLTFL